MGFNTFGPLLVVDAQLTPAAGVVGTVVDATTMDPVTTYSMSGTPMSLVTNARGYVGQFQAPDTSVMLRLMFGDLALDVVAKEAIASGGGAVTSVDGKTGAVSLSSTYAPIPTGTPDGTKFYKDDGTWAVPAGGGTGDVTGPAGAVAGNLAALDATGKVLSDSGSKPSDFAPALGSDDNYVTDAEKLALHTHPAVIAQGATAADARTAIGAGTSSFSGAYADLTGKPTLGTAAATASTDYATAAQGALAATALQPATGQTINPQTGTTYELVAGDAGKLVTCTNEAAITVTLPQDSAATFATGSRVDFVVLGAGMVTFAADAGSTVNGTPSLVTRAQYSAATAIKLAADTWLVVGDLATP